MRRTQHALALLLLLALGAQCEEVPRRARSADQFLSLIADLARAGAASTRASGPGTNSASPWSDIYLPPPITLASEGGATTSLQLVLVPVPQPQQCPLHAPVPATLDQAPPRVYFSPPSVAPVLNTVPLSVPYYNVPTSLPSFSSAPLSTAPPVSPERFVPDAPRPFAPTTPPVSNFDSPPPPPPPEAAPRPPSDERRARNAPYFPPVEDSQLLLQQFLAQAPQNPTLPPVVIEPLVMIPEDSQVEASDTTGLDAGQAPTVTEHSPSEAGANSERCRGVCRARGRGERGAAGEGGAGSPPLPRFERSVMMEAVLTVPRADYSEPYTVWWDAASGAARIDYHGGSTSTYRMMRLDGLMNVVQVRLDRTGETDVRRCTVLTPRRVSLAERALPVLPDLTGFNFAGYVEMGAGPVRVERWVRSVTGDSGAGGAARGEQLTHAHELLVARAPDNVTTTPLRYAVTVHSSVLGANTDSYVHRFLKVHTRPHDPAMFHLNIGDACEQFETTDQIDRVEPLREFRMLQRDPKYDAMLKRFKRVYGRRYADDLEEAVRLNVLVQSSRFVSSGNRKGASFELGVNFMADRLGVERLEMLGSMEVNNTLGEAFPHSDEELQGLRGRLPLTFDWRERGGVTPVRNQSLCASCWAFAVTGAVEGALFVNTGRLVPLSEQSLLDCGQPYGTNGCKSTWPHFAYDYVKNQGLPPLEEYTPYAGKVLQCEADHVPAVTRISGHVNVKRLSTIALKVAIRRHGPTVVLIDGETYSFAALKEGFYHDARCKKTSSNHAVLAVGWTVHRGETYFILKNSWTSAWGEQGYVKVRAASNTCGVLRRPSYPRLRAADVLRVPAAAPAAATPPPASAL